MKHAPKLRNSEFLKRPKGSIYEQGYGQISKLVMQDDNLTIEAKAIYAYLCSFSGGGNQAFPGVQKMCSDLSITPKRFYRHLNLLIDQGYILKKKQGKFAKVIYEILYTLKSK